MADSLSRKLEHEHEVGNLSSLQMVRRVKSLNHSQFANDTFLMGGVSHIISPRFKQVLDSFLDASSGAVNHRKCQIMGWNARAQGMQTISKIFQFPLVGDWTSF
jgi:hypothetical protein